MRWVLFLCALAAPACAPPLPPPEPVTTKTFRGRPLPEICLQPPAPLDDDGRQALRTLERHMVDDVLFAPDPEPEHYWETHDDGWINSTEVGHLMHKYSVTDVLFSFPEPIEIPRSAYHVRATGTVDELEHVDHPVFYVGLAKVSMVRAAGKIGLLFKYSAGPSGKPPKDVIWMWGVWGRVCAFLKPDGTWKAVPVGTVAVS
jgi:hypothetical protein